MRTKGLSKVNEKVIAGIAALAAVSICGAVYFGTVTDKGSSNDINPDGVAFAAPSAADGHIQIDDGPVPLADSFESAGELRDLDTSYSGGDELVEFNGSNTSGGGLILDDSYNNASGSELILDESGSNTSGSGLILDDSRPANTTGDSLILDNSGSNGSRPGNKTQALKDTLTETNGSQKDRSDSQKGAAKPSDAKNKQDEDNDTSSEAKDISALDEMMLKKINELRASEGAGKLSMDSELNGYAAVRAEEASTSWSHTRPNGTQGCDMISSSKYRAENLSCRKYSSFGYTQKELESAADAMFADLKASSMHYENMTFKNFTKIGIRTYVSKGSDGKVHLTTAYMFSN